MSTKPEQERGTVEAPVRKLRRETWECRACGPKAPCIVKIVFEPTDYPHIEGESRFMRRGCLCDARLVSDWKQLPNTSLTGREGGT